MFRSDYGPPIVGRADVHSKFQVRRHCHSRADGRRRRVGAAGRARRRVGPVRSGRRHHEVRAARSDRQAERLASADRVAAAGGRPEHHRAGSRPFLFRELPRNASDDRRCAVQPQRRRAGRGVSSRDGQDAVGAGAVRRRGAGRVSRHQRARRCALGGRQRPTALRGPRRISDRARCRDRKAGARVR